MVWTEPSVSSICTLEHHTWDLTNLWKQIIIIIKLLTIATTEIISLYSNLCNPLQLYKETKTLLFNLHKLYKFKTTTPEL